MEVLLSQREGLNSLASGPNVVVERFSAQMHHVTIAPGGRDVPSGRVTAWLVCLSSKGTGG